LLAVKSGAMSKVSTGHSKKRRRKSHLSSVPFVIIMDVCVLFVVEIKGFPSVCVGIFLWPVLAQHEKGFEENLKFNFACENFSVTAQRMKFIQRS